MTTTDDRISMPVANSRWDAWWVLALVMLLGGCKLSEFTEPQLLGGTYVAPETLQMGKKVYVQNCRSCHGDEGDGRGPASVGMSPAPRDLTLGNYRFVGMVPGYDLPRDEDLVRVISIGFCRTNMIPWGLTLHQYSAVVQYLKTLAPVWSDPESEMSPALIPTPDPYARAPEKGVELGETLYHTKAGCWGCHPGYASEEKWEEYGQDLAGLRPELDLPVALQPLPPDFVWDGVKAAKGVEGVYRTISRGLLGSPMPGYSSLLEENEIWAIAHYVDSLVKDDDS